MAFKPPADQDDVYEQDDPSAESENDLTGYCHIFE